MYIAKKKMMVRMKQAGSFQVCAAHKAGSKKYDRHAIYEVYQQGETETILLVHTESAFNSISRKTILANITTV